MTEKNKYPPGIFKKILERLLTRKVKFGAISDYDEQYEFYCINKGKFRACLWYIVQIFFAVPSFVINSFYWGFVMFKNYFKIVLRNIKKQKGYSFINIFGLAVGMACCILILLWVQDELSYDRFHKNADNIYRILLDPLNASATHEAVSPGILASLMKEEFPEVINATRYIPSGLGFKLNNESSAERCAYADPDFLKMFDFSLIKGNEVTVLSGLYNIVISERMAVKYFGNENPVNKTLTTTRGTDFLVTGVMRNVPHNSHLKFDCIIPFSLLAEYGNSIDSWGNVSFYTYVQLKENTSAKVMDEKLKRLIEERDPGHNLYYLQPLSKIHLYSNYNFDISEHGDSRYVTIFSIIAVFILIIACINFINLSTARSAKRTKEIGLRKVVGAFRFQLIRQFLTESVLLSVTGLIIAVLIVKIVLPTFNNFTGKPLSLNLLNFNYILFFFGIIVFSGFFSGIYPAVFLSSFDPVKIIKGTFTGKAGKSASAFRRFLVVFQFSISVFLIIGTGIVFRQLEFIKNANLGFDRENLIYINWRNISKDYETVKEKLLTNPNILGVTSCSSMPIDVGSGTSGAGWEGQNEGERVQMQIIYVNYDYLKTYGMEMASGRFYSKDYSTDPTEAIIVNESAVKAMGMESPLGKKFFLGRLDLRIIGIVKDFFYRPLKREVEPLILALVPQRTYFVTLRVKGENFNRTIDHIKSVWKEFVPDSPFQYRFLNERLAQQYGDEERMGKIFVYFTFLAVFISSLGLFGLASFVTELRIKEIGIRKVLGAGVTNILKHFTGEFIILLIFSNIIAWPLGYYFMNKWLQDFALRTSIDFNVFVLACFISIVIVLISVSYQVLRAAVSNPVNSLRNE